MNELEHWAVLSSSKSNSTFLPIFTCICSTLGMILSIIALMLLILTAILFAEWRQNYKNQLLIQFMVARFIFTFVRYFYDILNFFAIGNRYFYPLYLGKIPMAYSEIALVTWMCVFSKQMCDSLVKVFNIGSPSLRKVSLSAWLIPAAISILLFVSYTIQNDKDVQFYILYLFLLKWPALCAIGILLITALKSIINTNKSKTENNPRIIVVMIMLIFTFCFQQAVTDAYKLLYAIFNIDNEVVYTPVFFIFANIVTIYHCAFSILFWLFANKRTRMLWRFATEQKSKIHKRPESIICNTIS